MLGQPLVSAIVLNYKTPQDAVRCVRALLGQTKADGVTPSGVEVLVVDNHSLDDSVGVLRVTFRSEPRVRILETPRNRGYGQGNETAVDQATGKYLLIINPDNELEPAGVERMAQAMEDDPAIGILGPQLVHEDGTIRDSYRSFPTLTDIFIKRTFLRRFFPARMRRYLQHDADASQVRDVDWLAGACLLIRRDFFEEAGGFDPRFFLFFEDTDLCRRAWAAGRRVTYFPLVRATDRKHRLSQGGFLSVFTKKTVRIHLASAMKYFWKWRGQRSAVSCQRSVNTHSGS
ncbi:MAG: glycosyltransferase family 2 protein [Candidatus Peribacteraceae bacterium]|nr:glycosyltransferase family 2 protein [Candidatus Peribacteraceae bacterium]